MQDFSNASLWDLAYNLNPTDKELCSTIDPFLAENLEDMDSLLEIYYYLCYGDVHKLLPKTKVRINELLTDELNSEKPVHWYQFKNFRAWLNDELKNELTLRWLENDNVNLDDDWMISSMANDPDTNIKILSKLTRMYKKKKSSINEHLNFISSCVCTKL